MRWVMREVHGCTMVVRDDAGRLLLVRHTYGPRCWSLPGGGMKAHEDPLETARRELGEELGCSISGASLAGIQQDTFFGVPHHVNVVTGAIAGDPAPDGREVMEARFFALDALPADMTGTVYRRLEALGGALQQR